MVKLTPEMKEAFAGMKIFPFATASKNGDPNVVPIGFCKLQEDEETIWIADNYFYKTRKNLDENPRGLSISGDPKLKAATRSRETSRSRPKAKNTRRCTRWSSPWETGSRQKPLPS